MVLNHWKIKRGKFSKTNSLPRATEVPQAQGSVKSVSLDRRVATSQEASKQGDPGKHTVAQVWGCHTWRTGNGGESGGACTKTRLFLPTVLDSGWVFWTVRDSGPE